ncbi:hypothetical protein V6N13_096757 [Hibiscus sabdariffa]
MPRLCRCIVSSLVMALATYPLRRFSSDLCSLFGCVLAACSAFVSFFALSFSTDVRKGLSAPGGDRVSADRFCRCILLSPVMALGTCLLRRFSSDLCNLFGCVLAACPAFASFYV